MKIKKFFSFYNITNILFIIIYYPLREYYLNKKSLNKIGYLGLTSEIQTMTILLLFLVFRYRNKYHSFDHFLSYFFFFSKINICVLIFQNSNVFLFIYYLVFWFFSFLLIKPKKFSGKTNMIDINNIEFKEIIENCKLEEVKKKFIFCVFYANFSEHCRFTEFIWADFSNNFSHDDFLFCKSFLKSKCWDF